MRSSSPVTGFSPIRLGRFRRAALRILVSDSGHYAAEKIAAVMGLGRASVVSVPTDAAGVMDVDALDECLTDGPEVLA